MIKIEGVIGSKTTSNSWIVLSDKTCIIIDANEDVYNYVMNKRYTPNAIILTHEHFDHCCGVNQLLNKFDIPVYCSENSAEAIKDNRKNLSFYYDGMGFEIKKNIYSVVDESLLKIKDLGLKFIYTPGHSSGGMCILIRNYLFTGDTFMNDYKTPTNLPNGNKKELEESQKLINKLYNENKLIIMPGHGK